jgi:para-aminobenzoate synthetase / 4-amino-4-deoxychorismate lyase
MSRWHSLPAEVYALVEQTPATVLLECGKTKPTTLAGENCTRLFTAPLRVCAANTDAEIDRLFIEIESAVAAGQTAAGYFAYECGNCFEPKAATCAGEPGRPLAWFGIYERDYRFDHAAGGFVGGAPPRLERFRIDTSSPGREWTIDAKLELTAEQYAERIAAIHEWIRAGDVYQLNFTVPLSVRVRGSLADAYAGLRERQAAEYGAFMHWEEGRRILSLSPELFFRVDGVEGNRRIVTKPMKGTASRGRTTREDRDRAEWLRNDPKNRSENVMIVDLLRNDLGRLAQFGSVHTKDLFSVERYPTLLQMTSTVAGKLRPEVGYRDIFRALFPCGSITGAPKVRAMQLLAELEGKPRGVYTGAIGYFSSQCTMFNVAIRTLELDGNEGKMGVGSGIVIDSDAKEEYEECLLKTEFLTGSGQRASGGIELPDRFFLIEAMLWDGGYPLLQMHLDRLMDSAQYFGFACERAIIEAAIEEHARRFTDVVPRKVRLLADSGGTVRIADEVLPPVSDGERRGRVRWATERTDATGKWLFHKTTQRSLYARACEEAKRTGHADVLFLNQRGEVTEGAIGNVFVEKDGKLLTPPVACGLLAGVYRRYLLETRANVEERVLYPEDLRSADAVYVSNAVRGLRRVEIDWEA